jgi:ATP-dependent exoDNAse (exonuclease V) alpha subunit
MTQKDALEVLKIGKNVFLTGAAGSGKTYLLNSYISFLRERGVGIAVTASTGIAATHIKGVTIHAWSGIGIKDQLTDYDLDALESKEYLWKRYDKTEVLIIDEVSMISSNTLDCVDRVCKLFKRNEEPFGGMQVIFSGDFFQLPPIQKKPQWGAQQQQQNFDGIDTIYMDEDETSQTPYAFKSRAWKQGNLSMCYLTEQYRQDSEDSIGAILRDIRDGEISDQTVEQLRSRIIVSDEKDSAEAITKLHTHNTNVDSYNNKKLQELDGEGKTYTMTTRGKAPLIDALKRGCLVGDKILLKVGALVMFVKNNPTVGYVNGTTGKIVSFKDGYPLVETSDGKEFVAMPQTWAVEENSSVIAEISQVPLKLAWSITIHKSQGMTLSRAQIDLSGAFVEGQGYVALSRVKSLDGLYLNGFNKTSLMVHPEVININKRFLDDADILVQNLHKLSEDEVKKRKKDFLEKIGASKTAVAESSGKKLSTVEITCNLIKEQKTLHELLDIRGVKQGTIVAHIEALKQEGLLSSSDILYLMPENDEFSELIDGIREAVEEKGKQTLTGIRAYLKNKYSFDEIKFAKLFLE